MQELKDPTPVPDEGSRAPGLTRGFELVSVACGIERNSAMFTTSAIRSGFVVPPEDLCADIDRVWTWQAKAGAGMPIVLPGTGAELVIQLGDPLGVRGANGTVARLPRAFVLCLRSHSCELVCAGRPDFVSVRFRGSGVRNFGRLGMPELIDGFTDAAVVFGDAVFRLVRRLQPLSRLAACQHVVWQFLRKQRIGHMRPDAAADGLTDLLYYADPVLPVSEIADSAGLSVRQLERTVARTTGLSPKRFRRLARFHRTVRDMHLDSAGGYLPVALSHGYHDQAHFIHECREFAGHTPGALLRRARLVSHFYNTSLRAFGNVGRNQHPCLPS